MSRNYRIVARLLGFGGLMLVLAAARTNRQPDKSILFYLGMTLILATAVQTILFLLKPGLFKDKAKLPE